MKYKEGGKRLDLFGLEKNPVRYRQPKQKHIFEEYDECCFDEDDMRKQFDVDELDDYRTQ